jgi:hypothetical protein
VHEIGGVEQPEADPADPDRQLAANRRRQKAAPRQHKRAQHQLAKGPAIWREQGAGAKPNASQIRGLVPSDAVNIQALWSENAVVLAIDHDRGFPMAYLGLFFWLMALPWIGLLFFPDSNFTQRYFMLWTPQQITPAVRMKSRVIIVVLSLIGLVLIIVGLLWLPAT